MKNSIISSATIFIISNCDKIKLSINTFENYNLKISLEDTV